VRVRNGHGGHARFLVLGAVISVRASGCLWIRPVSVTPSGVSSNGPNSYSPPAVSADGRWVAFESWASDLVPGAEDAVLVRDTRTGRTSVASVRADGSYGEGGEPAISPDGRFVVFVSGDAAMVPGLNGHYDQVFIRDRTADTTRLVSIKRNGAPGNGDSAGPSVSADGRFVAYASAAPDIVPGDSNGAMDTFVFDRATGRTTWLDTDQLGAVAPTGASLPVLSADGRYAVFASAAPLSGANPTGSDQLFIREVSIPEIATLSPAVLTRGTATTVIVTGQGFLPVTTASASGGGITVDSAIPYGDGALVLSISVSAAAPPGSRDLVVTNAGTGPGTAATSPARCPKCITVQ